MSLISRQVTFAPLQLGPERELKCVLVRLREREKGIQSYTLERKKHVLLIGEENNIVLQRR